VGAADDGVGAADDGVGAADDGVGAADDGVGAADDGVGAADDGVGAAGAAVAVGGHESSVSFPVARSRTMARRTRCDAGTSTVAASLPRKDGGSRSGRFFPALGSPMARSGKSKRTRSMSSRPIQSSTAKRPMLRAVTTGWRNVSARTASTVRRSPS
jgi:hypothetical protein